MGIVKKFKREIRSIPSISTTMRKRKYIPIVRRKLSMAIKRQKRARPIPRTASYYANSSKLDKKRKCSKPYGKRRSASGKVYYETRREHTDKIKKRRY